MKAEEREGGGSNFFFFFKYIKIWGPEMWEKGYG